MNSIAGFGILLKTGKGNSAFGLQSVIVLVFGTSADHDRPAHISLLILSKLKDG